MPLQFPAPGFLKQVPFPAFHISQEGAIRVGSAYFI
jgi:hypothetical protein